MRLPVTCIGRENDDDILTHGCACAGACTRARVWDVWCVVEVMVIHDGPAHTLRQYAGEPVLAHGDQLLQTPSPDLCPGLLNVCLPFAFHAPLSLCAISLTGIFACSRCRSERQPYHSPCVFRVLLWMQDRYWGSQVEPHLKAREPFHGLLYRPGVYHFCCALLSS